MSGDAAYRKRVFDMAEFMLNELESLGAKTDTCNPGSQNVCGTNIPLPPVILANYPAVCDKSKKTVLVYGHYGVQPALNENGWNTEPFQLVEDKGCLFGRGSTDDKGPILGWLNVIEAHQKIGVEFPVNLKTCKYASLQSMSEMSLRSLVARTRSRSFVLTVENLGLPIQTIGTMVELGS